MRDLLTTGKICLIAISLFIFWGCSKANSNSPQLSADGKHPAGWIAAHGAQYKANPDQCATCHGSATDPAKSGGISGVSCFSASRGAQICHANGPSLHPAGWAAASQHGRAGAMVTPSATAGFAYCTGCHGSLYTNGTARSCLFCHTRAPHPDKPWHGTTASMTNHVFTDPGNASECAKCHRDGLNLTSLPKPPVQPAGTAAGCFNNTLCHGAATTIAHPAGWSSYLAHGAAAKSAFVSGGSTGFGYCQKCHGSDYASTATGFTCFDCHTSAPHAAAPWRAALPLPTHTNTDQSNAQFCDPCHRNGLNLVSTPAPTPAPPASTAAGCFNSTLCHGNSVSAPHITGASYLAGTAHGPDAKADLRVCQPCHATPASGSNPRFSVPKNLMANGCETASCHDQLTAHPIPWLPGRAGTPANPNTTTHATAGNLATACALCHGAALTGGNGPSCMSASIGGINCHATNPAVTPSGCTSCHQTPPGGSTFPNTANSHPVHQPFFATAAASCQACHNGFGVDFTTKIGVATHANNVVDVALLSATYLAKTGGAFSFAAVGKTCSNVSCHGGQTTPGWNTANQINVNTDCAKCHRSSTSSDQYNSYFSGAHGSHGAVACTTCHDTTKLQPGHFTNLATPAFEQHPRVTITFVNPDNNAVLTTVYNATTHVYTCTFTCHGETHSNRSWTGSP